MIIKDIDDFKSVTGGSGLDFMNTTHKDYTTDTRYTGDEHMLTDIKDSGSGGNDNSSNNSLDFSKESIEFTKEDIKAFYHSTTMSADPEDMIKNRFNKFGRFGYLDPTNELITGTREFLFFSKPDLHIFETDGSGALYTPLRNNSLIVEAWKHYRYSCYCLQQYFGGTSRISNDPSVGTSDSSVFNIKSLYIPILSNMVTSTLDLGDISAADVEGNRNLYQINTTYREGSIASDLQYDFSLEFKDTKYLDTYMIFKVYDEYFRHKFYEEIEPTRDEYITGRIFPEAISIWKVIVDDTDRIMYWAKAIGCTPMSVPRGSMSNFEGTVKFTINWKAQFVREMDPVNLMELNYLTSLSTGGGITKYNPNVSGNTWVGYPWIINDTGGKGSGSTASFRTVARTGDNSTKPQMFYRLAWLG